MLETTFGKDGHIETGDGLDTTRDDLAFESIKLLHGHVSERRKRDAFGYFNHVWARVGAETFEAVGPRRRIGAGVTATQATAVGKRVFDAAHTPTFLVEHQVVHHAADGQFGVLFDGIVL